ncbi:MAG: hypothetical protein ACLSHC_17895 [Bilophila wadsworthia]
MSDGTTQVRFGLELTAISSPPVSALYDDIAPQNGIGENMHLDLVF